MKAKIISIILLVTLIVSVLTTCRGTGDRKGQKGESLWWEDAVFYQIWPRSFQDSDGDGIGDFKGMTSRLDYLADLGITAIWLTPMFEAPSYHGYDFQEFYQVESDYGTMEDFEEFLEETEKRGIKVIADLVLNHISNQNEWFVLSAAPENGDDDPNNDNKYKDYFIWRKERPTNDPAAPDFEAWGKPWASPENPDWGYNKPEWVWIYNETRGEYYYGAFDGSQPDLNLLNPEVVKELQNLTKFWIDKGFDGFRLDAIRYAIETGGYPNQADTPETIDFWIDYKQFVKKYNPDIMLVGEVWASIDIISGYYSQGKGIDTCFDFEYGNEIMNVLNGAASEQGRFGSEITVEGEKTLVQALKDNFDKKKAGDAPVGFYSPFNTNHDQNRIMYNLANDQTKMKMAAVILLTTIGTPYLYYGEEIGMSQNTEGDDIFKRAPMQWDSSAYGGFTSGSSVWVDDGKWVPWRADHKPWWQDYFNGLDSKEAYTVRGQQKDPDSLLNLYKKLIAIRKTNREFRSIENDSLEFINAEESIAVYKRTAENGEASLVIINGSSKVGAETTVEYLKGKSFTNLLTGENLSSDGTVSLEAGGFLILKEK